MTGKVAETNRSHDDNETPTKEQLIVLIDSARSKSEIEHIETMLTRIGYSREGLMQTRLREKAGTLTTKSKRV